MTSRAVEQIAAMSPIKLAYAAQQIGPKLRIADAEPIAIVGMGCRFPGGADTPEKFWRVLRDGVDTSGEVPKDRWDMDALFDSRVEAVGKIYTRRGCFVDRIDGFDAHFFGISPREAKSLDPQQRMLLEVSWEALENANIPAESLFGSLTGVYVGMCASDYAYSLMQAAPRNIDAYFGTGTAFSAASGRLSYLLGLTGPSISVDTACSASLVSLHLACQALRRRECDMALAGGAKLIINPFLTMAFCRAHMLSPDGRCKSFDSAADGYGRGEGAGMVVLKRLSDALADNDNIVALIRGSAVNQDGASGGLTVPSGPAQQAVLRSALEKGGVLPQQVSYVEAHGTGTSLGDPIEMGALGAVFSEGRTRGRNPLLVGSVKTNIGHLEASAGIAGVIKVALALQHDVIPAHLHFRNPNPLIDWNVLPCEVCSNARPWPDADRRIAGVSSFSFSGTNAHVLMEAAPVVERAAGPELTRPYHALALSAKTAEALQQSATRYRECFEARPDLRAEHVCATAAAGRSHFHHRISLVGSSLQELQQGLARFERGESVPGLARRQISAGRKPRIAFLFTGQGSQYAGMGQELFDTHPGFRRNMERCAEILALHLDVALLDVLYPQPDVSSPLDDTRFAQPAIFSLEYALAELWRSWGIEPVAVMGHSVGAYAAACCAGVFSLEDGLALIAERGRLMASLPPGGAMTVVHASEQKVTQAVAPYADDVSLAARNGRANFVISGRAGPIAEIAAALAKEGIKTQPLTVSCAFHSRLIEPILADFERAAARVSFARPAIAFISDHTGSAAGAEVATASYWVRHARECVRFEAAAATLRDKHCDVLLEIGPRAALLPIARECLPDEDCAWLPSLRPKHSDWHQMLSSLGELYVRGAKVNWKAVDEPYTQQLVALPTYPFQPRRYWMECDAPALVTERAAAESGVAGPTLHPLLGRRSYSAALAPGEFLFESRLSANQPAFLEDHRIFGKVVVPGAAFLEMAIAAGVTVLKGVGVVLEDVLILQPLILPEGESRTVQMILRPREGGGYSLRVFSFEFHDESEPLSVEHVSARLGPLSGTAAQGLDVAAIEAALDVELAPEELYRRFSARGLEFGPAFRTVERIRCGAGQGFVFLRPPEGTGDNGEYFIHPALLDGCLQTVGVALAGHDSRDTYLPVAVQRLTFYRRPVASMLCHAGIEGEAGQPVLNACLAACNPDGTAVLEIEGLSIRRATREAVARSLQTPAGNLLYEVAWREKSAPATALLEPRRWLVFADGGAVADRLARELAASGSSSVMVRSGPQYNIDGAGSFTLDPGSPEHFRRLLRDCERAGPFAGCVHLWALDEQADTAGRHGCASVLHLLQALAERDSTQAAALWLVTEGSQHVGSFPDVVRPEQALVWGLGGVAAVERPDARCVRIDLDPNADVHSHAQALARELQTEDGEEQVAFRMGGRWVARLARRTATRGQDRERQILHEPYKLELSDYGSLDNLRLAPLRRRAPAAGEIEIEVRVSGLNFRDLLHALGLLKEHSALLGIQSPGDMPLGFECAGVVRAVGEGVRRFQVGQPVVALAWGAMNRFVIAPATTTVAKPENLSWEEAASIPMAFLTALYGLDTLAGMRAGDRVLIHAAAGGVGQAAVQLARRAGAEIFATAHPSKWELLRAQGVAHIMNSRTLDFAEEVMHITGARGVDIVLNSLSGEFLEKSWQVLNGDGRFVEIGKIGIWTEEDVARRKPQASYYPFDLGEVGRSDPALLQSLFEDLISDFERGNLTPPPIKTFPMQEAAAAFRFMANSKHFGKLLLTHPGASVAREAGAIRADVTYLITGGLGALGLKAAEWLVNQGAQRLVLNGRHAPAESDRRVLETLRQRADVVVVTGDISIREEAARVVAEALRGSLPLAGVLHAAGVLDDGGLTQQNWTRFERVLAPKVWGARHLDDLTADADLDFFVLFSSVAPLMGSPGQSNYAAANAYLDALAHRRRALGRPALSVNWGPWAGAGMAASADARHQKRLTGRGIGFLPAAQGLSALNELLRSGAQQAAVIQMNWPQFLALFPNDSAPAFYAELHRDVPRAVTAPEPTAKQDELLSQIREAPAASRLPVLLSFVQEQVRKVLGMPPGEVPEVHQSLSGMGLDSLMGLELKSRITSQLGIDIPIQSFISAADLEQIAGVLLNQLTLASVAAPAAAVAQDAPEDMEEIVL
jgi:myxalamid-type polyketide synthase MxaB